jgi:hypothetical protein
MAEQPLTNPFRIIRETVDLLKPITKHKLYDFFGVGSRRGHRFEIDLRRGENPINLTSATVTATLINHSAGITLAPQSGSIEDGKIVFEMPDAFYQYAGLFSMFIEVAYGTIMTVVYVCEADMTALSTDTVVDPSGTIPSLQELLAQIETMRSEITNARNATAAANEAATRAEAAAEVVENADVPTSTTVSYQTSNTGNTPPTGEWLPTVPAISPGQYLWVRVVQTFSASEPLTYYTISRTGIDGKGAVATVQGLAPDENGNVDLGAALLDTICPVGKLWFSDVNTSPAEILGGTWVRINNKFIYGAYGSGEFAAGATGGNRTITLAADQLPALTGSITAAANGNAWGMFSAASGVFSRGTVDLPASTASGASSSNNRASVINFSVGGGQAINIMPEFYAAFIWRRTA